MILPELVGAIVGDGAGVGDHAAPSRVDAVGLLGDTDRRADDVLRRHGLLYSDDLDDSRLSAEKVIKELARAYSSGYDVDRIEATLEAAGVLPWDETGPEHASDIVRWYAESHMRAAYYLGLAIGWRVSQNFGGAR